MLFLNLGKIQFFSVCAPALTNIWHKPDFPSSKPHLTIYDGKSWDFALQLRSRLQQINPKFKYEATGVEPLITKKGQGSFELRAAFDQELVKEETGASVTADDVSNLDGDERIDLIARLCAGLVERECQRTL